MPHPTRSGVIAAAAAVLALVGAAGCSAADDSPAQQAQARAQTGLLQSYVATYAVDDAKGKANGSVTVWRTPNRLRLDVTTASGVSTSITTPDGTVACQRPSNGRAPTCLKVAAPGATPPAAFDPVLRKVFGDVLRVLAANGDGSAPVQTTGTDTSAGATGQCYEVGATEGVVAAGTYCLTEDGVPTRFDFASGSGRLTKLVRTTPTGDSFKPAVTPTPLPTST